MSKLFKLTNTGYTIGETDATEIVAVIKKGRISITTPDCKTMEELRNLKITEGNCRVVMDREMLKNNILGITNNTHYMDMVIKVRDLLCGNSKEQELIQASLTNDIINTIECVGDVDVLKKISQMRKWLNSDTLLVFDDGTDSVPLSTAVRFAQDIGSKSVRMSNGKVTNVDHTDPYIDAVYQAEEQGLTNNEVAVALLLKDCQFKEKLAEKYVNLLETGTLFDKLVEVNDALNTFIEEDDNDGGTKISMVDLALKLITTTGDKHECPVK